MNALEREIVEKFHQLPPDSQARVLASLLGKPPREAFDVDAWLAELDAVQFTLQPDAEGRVPTAAESVNEVREERVDDIIHSLGFGDSAGDRPD